MLAHGQRQTTPRGRWRDDLDAATVGQGGREQRLFAVDTLVAGGGDLAGQALQGDLGEFIRRLAAHRACSGLDPDLAWPVDQHIGDVRA